MTANYKDQWFVIGISGVTCGGKTTLALKLKNVLCPVYVFNQDKYFYPDDSPKHVKCEGLEEEHNNYDILSSLDMERMYKDILDTMEGVSDMSIDRNTSDKSGVMKCGNKKVLIVEGFTVLNYKPILDLCDLRYYIVLDYGECLSRRSRRRYDPPDVPGYFETCAWPEHIRYRAEIEKDKSIKLLDGMRPDNFDYVVEELQTLGFKPS
ncbi:nicotinamide riboside kinase 1 [Plutella xylostella]|uniref:nicotinamide riboside kinase 1 n=1 Tax=Plutella xylostella TaxID=51655 RepID=UPI00203240E0|nr:nicotinamide riboside kinase 1 [Plutella xylostella]